MVEHRDRHFRSIPQVREAHQLAETFLLHQTVDKRHALGQVVIQDDSTHCRVEHVVLGFDGLGVNDRLIVVRRRHVDQRSTVAEPDRGLCFHLACIPCHQHFVNGAKRPAFTSSAGLRAREVVDAEHHVLCGNRDGLATGGRQQVLR